MDFKLRTFLMLCQTMNYRVAAEKLNLSQPAVTKQIQSLEQSLGAKLFHYDGHALHKTEKCQILERYAISMQYQFDELILALAKKGVDDADIEYGLRHFIAMCPNKSFQKVLKATYGVTR